MDTETAFTAVAILGMVTHPANMVMTIVPRAVAAMAVAGRIQSYLLKDSMSDQRGQLPSPCDPNSPSEPAILIASLAIGGDQPVLDNVSMSIPCSSVTAITGPVGIGKTTLLKAILGEVAPTRGTVSLVSKRIAYCSQKDWLPNGTIKQVIIGATRHEDELWYKEVIRVCCLVQDLESFPEGDESNVGGRGINISGGQRKRVVGSSTTFDNGNLGTADLHVSLGPCESIVHAI